jgi:hypothetical protein
MRTRTTVLIAAAALALPLVGLTALEAPTMFAGAAAPQYPVACKVAGDVAFNPPLTQSGTTGTSSSAVTTMTITSGKLTGCLSAAQAGAPDHGTLPTMTINIPATSLGRVHGVKTYATGYCPSFLGKDTLKALRGTVFDVTWKDGEGGTSVFTTKQVTTANNTSSEVGFTFSGKEGSGSYAESSLNEITVFFDATDSTALTEDCSGSQSVSAPTFDASNSVGIL